MMRALGCAVLGAVLGAVLPAAGPVGASGSTVPVVIGDRLDPVAVTVPVGGTVVWRNGDGERHRVRSTSGPEDLDSGNLEPDEAWAHVFTLPGRYRYVDAREPEAEAYWGTVTVTASAAEPSAPSGAAPSAVGDAAAGQAAAGGSPGSPGGSPGAAVAMVDRSFSPASTTVPVGTTVTWANDSDREHTVTADDGAFDSGEVQPGGRFSHTFAEPGTFGYLCVLHSGMRGTIVVGPADGAAASGEGTAGGSSGGVAPPGDGSASAHDAASEPPPGGARAVAVEVRDFAFAPTSVEVPSGGTVTWRHAGAAPHTVSAEDGAFDSGTLEPGQDFSHEFADPGTFRYVCDLHPEMVADVTVVGAEAATGPGAGGTGADRSASATAPAGGPTEAPAGGPPTAQEAAAVRTDAGTSPTAGLLVLALLVSAALLWGTWRIERALRAIASRAAPPGPGRSAPRT